MANYRTPGRQAEVNEALRFGGCAERLRRGRGYYYFAGGDTATWAETAVYVSDANALSVHDWLAEYVRLKEMR